MKTNIISYLQIRILLFRPILALLLTSEAHGLDSANGENETSLSRDMGIPCAQRCINSAIAMIDLVWAWRKENFPHFSIEALPAWWFQTFCEFIHLFTYFLLNLSVSRQTY